MAKAPGTDYHLYFHDLPVEISLNGSPVSGGNPLPVNASVSASIAAFAPKGVSPLSVTNVSARVALPTADTGLVLRNTGSTDAYFKLGNSSVAAATTDYLIKAGEVLCLDATGATHIAGITASGTTTFAVWTGTGLITSSQAGGTGGGGGGNVNLNQVGGASYALGAAASAASMPVTIASDQSNVPVAVKDRLEVTGTISSAAVLSNFPVTDTSGYRSLVLQVTAMAAASTMVVEESNDGTTWSNLTSAGGLASLTATGLYGYNFSAKQLRVRQSVYGGAGSSTVTAELRLAAIPHDYAIGALADAQATDATSSWSVIAMLKGIYTKLGSVVLAAGTAVIGKVSIDQTTPGSTDSVTLATGQGAGATIGVTSGAAVITDANGTLQQYLRGLVKVVLVAFGATGAAVPANASYKGLLAKTALPAAATDGNLTGAMADKFGRQIVRGAPRDLLTTAALNTTGTSGTLLAAQAAGVFADMYRLVIANSSAAAVLVTISDGTNSYGYEVPANGTVGFSGPAADATPAAGAATAWTYTVATGTTTIYIHAQFILNK